MRLEIPGATEILIGRGLPTPLLPARPRGHVIVLFQPGAAEVARQVIDEVSPAGHVELPDGEEAKALSVVETIYRALDRCEVRRDGAIVGVGGGSVTDVAGFVAATWLRGIESVYVPTTLLGAVDASIGGKTGINFDGKNLVGAFWHPSRVAIDLDVLEQLPQSIAREGWAEIVKAGLIADPALLGMLEERGFDGAFADAVTRAVRVKVDIVAQDFREAGARAHLNFGHTIGHALEVASRVSHGEAVGLGLIAEAAASRVDRGFSGEDRVRDLVRACGLPTRSEPVDSHLLRTLIAKDKKADVEGLRMVLLDDVGRPVVARPTPNALAAAWDAIGLEAQPG